MRRTLETSEDDLTMAFAPDHSEAVAADLRRAYAAFKRLDYAEARAWITHCQDLPMSGRQRLRVYFLRSLIAEAERDYDEAIGVVDGGLDLALALDDLEACPDLARRAGWILTGQGHHRAAAEHYDIALDALRELAATPETADPALMADVLVELSIEEFFLARADACATHLDEARSLVTHAAEPRLQAAKIDWTSALLERWRGDLWHALGHARTAAEGYSVLLYPASHGRILTVMANVLLDLVEASPPDLPGSDRDDYLALAEKHLAHAIELTRTSHDFAGEIMALLARARCPRVRGQSPLVDQSTIIKDWARQARDRGDAPLLGQILTTLGDESAAHGRIVEARAYYHEAIATFTSCESPALCVWPQRALRRLED